MKNQNEKRNIETAMALGALIKSYGEEEITKENVKTLLSHLSPDGSMNLLDNWNTPSEIRVEMSYNPTYLTAQIVMKYLLKTGDESVICKLSKLLEWSTKRLLFGHEYDADKDLNKNMRMFIDANLNEFLYKYPNLCPEFTLMILEILNLYRSLNVGDNYYEDAKYILSKIDYYAVFVYGTLLKGEKANDLINEKLFIANTIIDEFDFYNLGTYPAIKHGEGKVVGELYLVNKDTLAKLDRYEGEGSLYNSEFVNIKYNNIRINVFTYVYNNKINKLPINKPIASWKDNYIWYVCYGSNLLLDRFMCYLTGNSLNKYGVKEYYNRRFKDVSMPILSKVVEIPYELYFGSESSNWDNGGVAFLDKDKNANTIARAYLITKEQYKHVKKYEGSKYQYEIKLDDIDGIPAITFTNENRFNHNNPSDKYAEIIKDGLKECGLSGEEAIIYIKNHFDK